MNIYPFIVLAGIIIVAIVGVFARPLWARLILWILAIPPLGLGLFALWQGGIAEPFSTELMVLFCGVMFLPATGCLIGQVRCSLMREEITGRSHGNGDGDNA